MKRFYLPKSINSRLICSSVVILFVSGCGGREYPPTYETTGLITLDGKPIEGVTVSFLPQDGQQPANGKTDTNGQYRLTSFSRNDGAMAGTFAIVMMKFPKIEVVTTPTGIPWDPDKETDEYIFDDGKEENKLPEKYADSKTSGMLATVVADTVNTFDFELSSR